MPFDGYPVFLLSPRDRPKPITPLRGFPAPPERLLHISPPHDPRRSDRLAPETHPHVQQPS